MIKKENLAKENCIISLIEISLLFISIFAFASLIAIPQEVSAEGVNYCCEKTTYGAWCQNAPENECDTSNSPETGQSYKKVPASCEATSFCKKGCCYDSKEGTCDPGTPQIVCQEDGGTWHDDAFCNIPQCEMGCCVLGTETSLVSLVRCKKLSALFNLETDFRKDITSELDCIDLSRSQEKGACVYEVDYTKTCQFTTRQECKSIEQAITGETSETTAEETEGSFEAAETNMGEDTNAVALSPALREIDGTITSEISFHPGWLCSAEELGTDCGISERTTCVEGLNEVYFVDTCGNVANIYDYARRNDKTYWNKVVKKEDSCNAGKTDGNANSKTCGNCDYFYGSTCRQYQRIESTRPSLGDNICKALDCPSSVTSDGSERRHGESWCETDNFENSVGSIYERHLCVEGEEIVETCADYRQEVCVSQETSTDHGIFEEAACRVNRWQDCAGVLDETDCGNKAVRDCQWIQDERCTSEFIEEIKDKIPAEYQTEDGFRGLVCCVPEDSPGLKWWEEGAEEVCSVADTLCIMKFERGLFDDDDGWECVKNCDCENPDGQWATQQKQKCRALGDCDGKINFVGEYGSVAGYEFTVDEIEKAKEKYAAELKGKTESSSDSGQVFSQGSTSASTDTSSDVALSPEAKKVFGVITGGVITGYWLGLPNFPEAASVVGDTGSSAASLGQIAGPAELPSQQLGLGDFSAWAAEQPAGEAVPWWGASGGDVPITPASTPGTTSASTTPKVYGTFANSWLASGLVWGGILGLAGGLIGAFLGPENSNAGLAGGLGGFAGGFVGGSVGNLLAASGSGTFWTGAAGQLTTGGMIASVGLGAVVGFGVFALLYEEKEKRVVIFRCQPWQAPLGGENCEECNKENTLCSEYRCKSLGQSCDLVNVGTEEQKCYWKNRDDTKSPGIKPWIDVLTSDYSYREIVEIPEGSTRPGKMRITPENNPNGCIKAFTPITFGIQNSEPAQCALDFNQKAYTPEVFEQMTYLFDSGLFLYNHSMTLNLPGPSNVEGENATINNNGEYSWYVRCRDANGNMNVGEFNVKFCTEKGPDTTPPVILGTSIQDNKCVQFGTTQTKIEVYVNEPAECKWSFENRDYDIMENTMTCANTIRDINNQGVYTCVTTLTGIKDRQDNVFYFRCKDNPKKADKDRNTMQQAETFTLKGSEPVVIKSIKPVNGTAIQGSTEPLQINFEVETDYGCYDGESWCSYSSTANGPWVYFYSDVGSTGFIEHNQSLPLFSGNYKYYIQCEDEGGNKDIESVEFSVFVDRTEPKVIRAYEYENKLKLWTNEKATCKFGINSCDYEFAEGINIDFINSTEHQAEWNLENIYYIKCQDESGNIPSPDECTIVVKPSEI